MKLAVLFPGMGYHMDKPLLYYAKDLAAVCGYEIMAADYGELPRGVKGSPEKMKDAFEKALKNSLESLAEVKGENYKELLFISKSIGTAVSSAVADKLQLKTKNIYFTPVGETFLFPLQKGIAFHGTADTWVDTKTVQTGCETYGISLYITEGVNHSMENDDTIANIRVLEQIMKQVKQYIE